jgi:hypothetical protein
MKRCALLLAIAGLSMAGPSMKSPVQKTFTGVIHDNRCVGPNCARQCPATRDPKYTLQSGDDAWVLSDQRSLAGYTGKKVVVTGMLGPRNTLVVSSIAPAK